jgi:hypothetical protein
MVVTAPLAAVDPAWHAIIDEVHARGALIAARVVSTSQAIDAAFDLLLLDPGDDPEAIEQLPARVAEARTRWRTGGWIGAVVVDRPATRSVVVGHAAQLVRAGANLIWVTTAPGATSNARVPAAPLADRLRNELGVATCVDGAGAVLPDLDAAIAAGRADLVVVERFPAARRS